MHLRCSLSSYMQQKMLSLAPAAAEPELDGYAANNEYSSSSDARRISNLRENTRGYVPWWAKSPCARRYEYMGGFPVSSYQTLGIIYGQELECRW